VSRESEKEEVPGSGFQVLPFSSILKTFFLTAYSL